MFSWQLSRLLTPSTTSLGNWAYSEESLTESNGQTLEESNISSDDKLESGEVEINSNVEDEQSNNIDEIDVNEKEIENKATNYAQVKKYGKLEFDINFAMPIINTDSIHINLFNEKAMLANFVINYI